MQQQKIYIVVTPFFPSPTQWRGAYCYDFVFAMEHYAKVFVFVPGDGSDYEYQGVTVHTFKTRHLPSNVFPFLFRRYNERSFLDKLYSVLTSNNQSLNTISVCHAHTANFAIYPLAFKKLNHKCKTILHHHDLMSFGLNIGRMRHCGWHNQIVARQLKRLHERIDYHVFISCLCQRSFESFPNIDWLYDADYSAQARGVKKMTPVRIKRSIVLHNGVDTTIFHPAENKVDNSTVHLDLISRPEPLTVGCIGNVEPEKGQYDLLCALKIVKDAGCDVRCRMIGSGLDMERCKTFARYNGLNVEFLPEMRHEKLPDFYRSLDLFVLPTWLDGFGCVFTEAYACGVPFIATVNAGVEDMIPDDERELWLCKLRDPNDLAEKILYYIKNRPMQHLKGEIEIDALVADFCKQIGVVR